MFVPPNVPWSSSFNTRMSAKSHSSPHIRDTASVPGIMWTVVLALAPAFFTFLFFSGSSGLRVSTVALATAILTEMAIRKILGRRITIYDGSAVITAILLVLLLPPSLPSWMIALGSFFAIVMGKEIFGGLGQNIFNPALVGFSFLVLSFPSVQSLLSMPSENPEGIIKSVGIFVGGILLCVKRIIAWEIPLIFLAVVWIFDFKTVYSHSLLLAGFFIVTDPVTTPLTRMGNRGFALGAGVLTALFRLVMTQVEAFVSGILWMNALTPWLDRRSHSRR